MNDDKSRERSTDLLTVQAVADSLGYRLGYSGVSFEKFMERRGKGRITVKLDLDCSAVTASVVDHGAGCFELFDGIQVTRCLILVDGNNTVQISDLYTEDLM